MSYASISFGAARRIRSRGLRPEISTGPPAAIGEHQTKAFGFVTTATTSPLIAGAARGALMYSASLIQIPL